MAAMCSVAPIPEYKVLRVKAAIPMLMDIVGDEKRIETERYYAAVHLGHFGKDAAVARELLISTLFAIGKMSP